MTWKTVVMSEQKPKAVETEKQGDQMLQMSTDLRWFRSSTVRPRMTGVDSKTQTAVEMEVGRLAVWVDNHTDQGPPYTLVECRGERAKGMAILVMKYASMCLVDRVS